MSRFRSTNPKHRAYSAGGYRQVVRSKDRSLAALGKRARGVPSQSRASFIPPEDWHEPAHRSDGRYRCVVQPAGEGYRHVLTPTQVRERLAELPDRFVRDLEVVQFSRMTRKKQSYPCYGMQWGTAIYLYPVEEGLIEHYAQPPRPAVYNEARMFGGRWVQEGASNWRLEWTKEAIEDFYLNNVLIHELGHLVDHRNSSYRDRERFAEWFAIEYGYRPTRRSVSLAREEQPADAAVSPPAL
ncbi:MAG: ImmA/IrrE family metallo-endopeptidase [Pirellulaceae bacterium]